MEATFHGIVAAVGIVLGVVALVLFCKMKKWWNDCAGSDSHIQESTRRHWSRVRAGLRRRRVGDDLEGGYQRIIGIPLPEVPDIADVASPEVPAVHYSCGVQGDDGRVTGKFDRRAWKRVNNIRGECPLQIRRKDLIPGRLNYRLRSKRSYRTSSFSALLLGHNSDRLSRATLVNA